MKKDRAESINQLERLAFSSFCYGQNGAIDVLAIRRVKILRVIFLMVLALAKITFTHVIIKRHVNIMKKQQMILFVFLSVQERNLFLGDPSKTYWMLFAFMFGQCKQCVKTCLRAQERF